MGILTNPVKEVSEGGIHLPPEAQKKETTGIVLVIGDEVPRDKVEEGDKVVFPQYAGTEIELEDDEGDKATILFMDYTNIVAVVEE